MITGSFVSLFSSHEIYYTIYNRKVGFTMKRPSKDENMAIKIIFTMNSDHKSDSEIGLPATNRPVTKQFMTIIE